MLSNLVGCTIEILTLLQPTPGWSVIPGFRSCSKAWCFVAVACLNVGSAEHDVRRVKFMFKTIQKALKVFVSIVLLLLLSPHSTSAQETQFEKVGHFIYNSVKVPETKKLIIDRFGQPDSLITKTITNKYDSTSVDTIYKLFYKGFEFETYCVTKTKKCLLTVFILHSDNFTLPLDIKLGMSKTDIKNIFGKPIHEDKKTLSYHDDAELTSHLKFFFNDDRNLTKIIWFHEE